MWLGRWIALLTITLSPLAFSSEISCKVVAISDGDTFICLDASRSQIKVRMANIDTPKSKQPYGQKAKQELSELLFGKDIPLEAEAKTGTGALSGMPMLTAYMPTEKWLPRVPLGCIANTTAINP
ncbi:thermonuclease family protein [Pseudomonas sp. BN102]|uniref:thermonuclease family protein n=1 Tax=Pseudomonas sp. BN102 TaxID=2567886 RepID=UPI0024554EC9|nr:thermonuclease family protein [Pseudomonas sp. BN102]